MGEVLRWGDLSVPLDRIRAALDDPKTLQPFAKRMRERAKAWIASEGRGSWAGLAESTRKKYASQGHSEITKFGKIRTEKLRALEAQIRRVNQQTAKSFGDRDRKRVQSLQRRVQRLRDLVLKPVTLRTKAGELKQKAQALADKITAAQQHKSPKTRAGVPKMQERLAQLHKKIAATSDKADALSTYKRREIGETTAQRRDGKMMPHMGRTIRVKVQRESKRVLVLTLSSKSGIVGVAQNDGLGKGGKPRRVLPPVEADDLRFVGDLLEGKCLDAWEGK